MPASLRPLSTGELLDKTFTLYRRNFPLFFGIAALAQLGPFIVLVAMTGMFRSANGQQTASSAVTVAVAGLITVFAYLIATILASGLIQAATTFAVSSLYLDEPVSIRSAYARVKGLVWRSVNVVVSVGIRVVGGFMLLLIPGIIMLRRYSLSVPAAVLENLKTRDALKRSRQLSEGSGGRVLLVYVLMVALIWAVSFGFAWLLGLVFTPQTLRASFAAQAVQQFSSYLVGAAVGPVLTIAFSLLYYDQRVRKEAFDIEHMMTMLQSAGSSTSAAAVGGTA
jgi:hypothetical protein